MPFERYAAAKLQAGKTVPLTLDMLPRSSNGEFPVVHLELLGKTNATWLNEAIAKSNTKNATGEEHAKLSPKQLREQLKRLRETLVKHGIRRLENVFHDDGRAATDADIAEFVEGVPDDVVETMFDFAANKRYFRNVVVDSDPRGIAEK